MIVLDVNVVMAAHRADHPNHSRARPWLEELIDSSAPFGAPNGVWTSFLRVATTPRLFAVPTTRDAAFAFIDAIRGQPSYLPIDPGPRHFELVRRVCEEADATGKLVPDAVIAAVALEHGATIATLDRDFARFAMVRYVRVGA